MFAKDYITGLRGVYITKVMLAHAAASMPLWVSSSIIYRLFVGSPLGVNLAFVISGYVITGLLLKDIKSYGGVQLRQFYTARLLRILPVFLLYITFLMFIWVYFLPDILNSISDVIPALLFIWNYKQFFMDINSGEIWYLGHFWSLSMIVQFYIILPVFFHFYNGQVVSNKNLRKLTFCILLMPVLRLSMYLIFGKAAGPLKWMFHTGCDFLLIGSWGAIVGLMAENNDNIKIFLSKRWLASMALIYLIFINHFLSNRFGVAYSTTIGMPICGFILMYLILFLKYTGNGRKVLEAKPLVYLGSMSFSLFVWQQFFLHDRIHKVWTQFPYNFLLLFVVGFTSYYLVEKPMHKWRRKKKVVDNIDPSFPLNPSFISKSAG